MDINSIYLQLPDDKKNEVLYRISNGENPEEVIPQYSQFINKPQTHSSVGSFVSGLGKGLVSTAIDIAQAIPFYGGGLAGALSDVLPSGSVSKGLRNVSDTLFRTYENIEEAQRKIIPEDTAGKVGYGIGNLVSLLAGGGLLSKVAKLGLPSSIALTDTATGYLPSATYDLMNNNPDISKPDALGKLGTGALLNTAINYLPAHKLADIGHYLAGGLKNIPEYGLKNLLIDSATMSAVMPTLGALGTVNYAMSTDTPVDKALTHYMENELLPQAILGGLLGGASGYARLKSAGNIKEEPIIQSEPQQEVSFGQAKTVSNENIKEALPAQINKNTELTRPINTLETQQTEHRIKITDAYQQLKTILETNDLDLQDKLNLLRQNPLTRDKIYAYIQDKNIDQLTEEDFNRLNTVINNVLNDKAIANQVREEFIKDNQKYLSKPLISELEQLNNPNQILEYVNSPKVKIDIAYNILNDRNLPVKQKVEKIVNTLSDYLTDEEKQTILNSYKTNLRYREQISNILKDLNMKYQENPIVKYEPRTEITQIEEKQPIEKPQQTEPMSILNAIKDVEQIQQSKEPIDVKIQKLQENPLTRQYIDRVLNGKNIDELTVKDIKKLSDVIQKLLTNPVYIQSAKEEIIRPYTSLISEDTLTRLEGAKTIKDIENIMNSPQFRIEVSENILKKDIPIRKQIQFIQDHLSDYLNNDEKLLLDTLKQQLPTNTDIILNQVINNLKYRLGIKQPEPLPTPITEKIQENQQLTNGHVTTETQPEPIVKPQEPVIEKPSKPIPETFKPFYEKPLNIQELITAIQETPLKVKPMKDIIIDILNKNNLTDLANKIQKAKFKKDIINILNKQITEPIQKQPKQEQIQEISNEELANILKKTSQNISKPETQKIVDTIKQEEMPQEKQEISDNELVNILKKSIQKQPEKQTDLKKKQVQTLEEKINEYNKIFNNEKTDAEVDYNTIEKLKPYGIDVPYLVKSSLDNILYNLEKPNVVEKYTEEGYSDIPDATFENVKYSSDTIQNIILDEISKHLPSLDKIQEAIKYYNTKPQLTEYLNRLSRIFDKRENYAFRIEDLPNRIGDIVLSDDMKGLLKDILDKDTIEKTDVPKLQEKLDNLSNTYKTYLSSRNSLTPHEIYILNKYKELLKDKTNKEVAFEVFNNQDLLSSAIAKLIDNNPKLRITILFGDEISIIDLPKLIEKDIKGYFKDITESEDLNKTQSYIRFITTLKEIFDKNIHLEPAYNKTSLVSKFKPLRELYNKENVSFNMFINTLEKILLKGTSDENSLFRKEILPNAENLAKVYEKLDEYKNMNKIDIYLSALKDTLTSYNRDLGFVIDYIQFFSKPFLDINKVIRIGDKLYTTENPKSYKDFFKVIPENIKENLHNDITKQGFDSKITDKVKKALQLPNDFPMSAIIEGKNIKVYIPDLDYEGRITGITSIYLPKNLTDITQGFSKIKEIGLDKVNGYVEVKVKDKTIKYHLDVLYTDLKNIYDAYTKEKFSFQYLVGNPENFGLKELNPDSKAYKIISNLTDTYFRKQSVFEKNIYSENDLIKIAKELSSKILGDIDFIVYGSRDEFKTVFDNALIVGFASRFKDKNFLGFVIDNNVNAVKTIGHEIFHLAYSRLSDYDKNILFNRMKDIETLADEFGKYIENKLNPPSYLKRLFDKVLTFIEKIRNYFKGLGFTSANDIFERIYAGEYAKQGRIEEIPVNRIMEVSHLIRDKETAEMYYRQVMSENNDKINELTDKLKYNMELSGGVLKELAKRVYLKFHNPQNSVYPVIRELENTYIENKAIIEDTMGRFFKQFTNLRNQLTKRDKGMLNNIISNYDSEGKFPTFSEFVSKFKSLENPEKFYNALKSVKLIYDNDLLLKYRSVSMSILKSLEQTIDNLKSENLIDDNRYSSLKSSIQEFMKYSSDIGFGITDIMTAEDVNYRLNLINDFNTKLSDLVYKVVDETTGLREIPVNKQDLTLKPYIDALISHNDKFSQLLTDLPNLFYAPRRRGGGEIAITTYGIVNIKENGEPVIGKLIYWESDKKKTLTGQRLEARDYVKNLENNFKADNTKILTVNIEDIPDGNVYKFINDKIKEGYKFITVVGWKDKLPQSALLKLSPIEMQQALTKALLHMDIQEKDKVLSEIPYVINELYADLSTVRQASLRRKFYLVEGYSKEFVDEVIPNDVNQRIGSHAISMFNLDTPSIFQKYANNLKTDRLLYNSVMDYIDMINARHNEFASHIYRVRQLSAIYYLGANLKSALLNYINYLTVFLPETYNLGTHKYLPEALSYTFDMLKRGVIDKNLLIDEAKITQKDKEFITVIKEAVKRGTLESTLSNEIRQEGMRLFHPYIQNTLDTLMLPFRMTETHARLVSLYSVYKALRDRYPNMPIEEIAKQSSQIVDNTFFRYTKENSPLFANPSSTTGLLLSIPKTLQSYTFNYLTILTRWLYDKEYKKVALSMVPLLLLGGISSVIGYNTFMEIIEDITKEPVRLKVRKGLNELFGDDIGTAIYKGLPTLFGIDIASSLQTDIPFIPRELSVKGLAETYFGATSTIVDSVNKAITEASYGNYTEAGKNLLPMFAKNLISAYEGQLKTSTGNPLAYSKNQPIEMTDKERILKALGFNSPRTSTIQETKYLGTKLYEQAENMRQKIYTKIKQGIPISDLTDEIQKYNEYAREYALPLITPETIRRSRMVLPNKGLETGLNYIYNEPIDLLNDDEDTPTPMPYDEDF